MSDSESLMCVRMIWGIGAMITRTQSVVFHFVFVCEGPWHWLALAGHPEAGGMSVTMTVTNTVTVARVFVCEDVWRPGG